MTMTSLTCKDFAEFYQRSLGWTFMDMLHTFFGNGTLVFVGEGKDGSDIEIAATEKWLTANHLTTFKVHPQLFASALTHLSACKSSECAGVMERQNILAPLLRSGVLPGGRAIDTISKCAGGSEAKYTERITFVRVNGFGKFIDKMMPIISWFTDENKDFWKWPDEEKADSKEI